MIVLDQMKRNDQQLRLLTLVVLTGLSILLGGLWIVQVLSAQRYKQREQIQSIRTVLVPAMRGKILDRNHLSLAENRPSYNLNLYLEELRPYFSEAFQQLRPMTSAPPPAFWKPWLGLDTPAVVPARLGARQRDTLNANARYLVVSNIIAAVSTNLDVPAVLAPRTLLRHYSERLVLPLPVMRDLEPAQAAWVEEQGSVLPGLSLDIQPLRYYPRRTTACHILGQLQSRDSAAGNEPPGVRYRLPDYRGLVGIEGAYDEELRGQAGMKAVLVNNLGYRQSEHVWLEAEPGMNVVLTIDLYIQEAVEQALRRAATKGAVVVLDANSGDIYALASVPAFDPNQLIPRLNTNYSQYLNDDDLRPQKNRALQENYSPGSIFKLVTSLALLENGLNPEEVFNVEADPRRPGKGAIRVGARTIEDTAAPGPYKFVRAFMKSSNSYFIHFGLQMRNGLEEILRMAQALHLGEKTGIPTRQEVAGTLPTREWRARNMREPWTDGRTANLCIGQGELDVTPVQMAVAYAAVANGGKVFRPRLVARLEPQDPFGDQQPQDFPAAQLRNTLPVSQRTLNIIRDAMRADVEDPEGTGKLAAVPGWRVCGKTGTAENDPRRHRGKTTWFASFAPYESPRYVVLVMVEGGASGTLTCAPVAGEIYRALQRREQMSQDRVPAERRP